MGRYPGQDSKVKEELSVKKMLTQIGTDIYTPLYAKQMTNKNLLCSTGNSNQYSVMAYFIVKNMIGTLRAFSFISKQILPLEICKV